MSSKKAGRRNSDTTAIATPGRDGTVEVLYQKMGDRWFAFSLIDDEVFVGSIAQHEIDELDSVEGKSKKVHPISGNS